MAASSAGALQDLGALVLSNDTLDLKQQVVLGGAADRTVEEDDLCAGPAQLLNQEHLMGIAAGEGGRRMHKKANQKSCRSGIPQKLQSRAQQDGSPVGPLEQDVPRGGLMGISSGAAA